MYSEKFSKATTLDKIFLYGYVIKNRIKKKKRDLDLIQNEWNESTWSKYTINDFPFGSLINKKPTDEIELYQIGKDIVRIPRNQFLDKLEKRVLGLFSDSVDKSESIVELGVGIGNKLFFLWKNGYKRLEGYDLSENAITLAKQINDKFNCGIKFGIADITKDIPSLNLENKVIFTYACLEQLKHYMKPILEDLLKMKPRMVIHFEFSLEHSTRLSREYIKARDYQANLLPLLKQMQDEDLIKIVRCDPVGVSSPVVNLTFISWKPKKCKSRIQKLTELIF